MSYKGGADKDFFQTSPQLFSANAFLVDPSVIWYNPIFKIGLVGLSDLTLLSLPFLAKWSVKRPRMHYL
jgi:hypothetical protein